MFKKMTAATLVLSSLLVSSVSHAKDSAVELHVESMMAGVVSTTNLDISYSVQESVLKANNVISLQDNESLYSSTDTITDLDSKESAFRAESPSAE